MPLPISPHWLSALEVGTAIARDEFSSLEITRAMLDRIAELDPRYRPPDVAAALRAFFAW